MFRRDPGKRLRHAIIQIDWLLDCLGDATMDVNPDSANIDSVDTHSQTENTQSKSATVDDELLKDVASFTEQLKRGT